MCGEYFRWKLKKTMAIDYINALGAGASFDTKKIVEALVEAERAPARALIQRRVDEGAAKITGLASAASILNKFKVSAQNLNDARDFNTYSINNSPVSYTHLTLPTKRIV